MLLSSGAVLDSVKEMKISRNMMLLHSVANLEGHREERSQQREGTKMVLPPLHSRLDDSVDVDVRVF